MPAPLSTNYLNDKDTLRATLWPEVYNAINALNGVSADTTVPKATVSTAGTVKVGAGISVAVDGTISVGGAGAYDNMTLLKDIANGLILGAKNGANVVGTRLYTTANANDTVDMSNVIVSLNPTLPITVTSGVNSHVPTIGIVDGTSLVKGALKIGTNLTDSGAGVISMSSANVLAALVGTTAAATEFAATTYLSVNNFTVSKTNAYTGLSAGALIKGTSIKTLRSDDLASYDDPGKLDFQVWKYGGMFYSQHTNDTAARIGIGTNVYYDRVADNYKRLSANGFSNTGLLYIERDGSLVYQQASDAGTLADSVITYSTMFSVNAAGLTTANSLSVTTTAGFGGLATFNGGLTVASGVLTANAGIAPTAGGGGQTLSSYLEGTATLSISNFSVAHNVDIVYVKVGKLVSLTLKAGVVSTTGTLSDLMETAALPVALRPTGAVFCTALVSSGAAPSHTIGLAEVSSDGVIHFGRTLDALGGFTVVAGEFRGVVSFTVSYSTDV